MTRNPIAQNQDNPSLPPGTPHTPSIPEVSGVAPLPGERVAAWRRAQAFGLSWSSELSLPGQPGQGHQCVTCSSIGRVLSPDFVLARELQGPRWMHLGLSLGGSWGLVREADSRRSSRMPQWCVNSLHTEFVNACPFEPRVHRGSVGFAAAVWDFPSPGQRFSSISSHRTGQPLAVSPPGLLLRGAGRPCEGRTPLQAGVRHLTFQQMCSGRHLAPPGATAGAGTGARADECA